MKCKNIYNVLSKFIHVLTPLIILICSIYESIIYKKVVILEILEV